jgi:hypothetical protein
MDQLDKASLDRQLKCMADLMRSDKALAEEIVGRIPATQGQVLWEVQDGSLTPTVSGKAISMLRHGAEASGRAEEGKPSTVAPILAIGNDSAFCVTLSLPGRAISANEENESLKLRLWICHDATLARQLYWIRSGHRLQGSPRATTANVSNDARFREFRESDIGELAYEFYPQLIHSVILAKGDPRAGGNRVGFLRENIVCEAETWSYLKSPDGAWRCFGMSESDRKEALKCLAVLDRAIRSAGSAVTAPATRP